MLKYIELKTGYSDNGPAWVAEVTMSRSVERSTSTERPASEATWCWATITRSAAAMRTGCPESRRTSSTGTGLALGKVAIEASAVTEYLRIVGAEELDASKFEVVADLPRTEPAAFYDAENRSL